MSFESIRSQATRLSAFSCLQSVSPRAMALRARPRSRIGQGQKSTAVKIGCSTGDARIDRQATEKNRA
jgi:hypothetical protein